MNGWMDGHKSALRIAYSNKKIAFFKVGRKRKKRLVFKEQNFLFTSNCYLSRRQCDQISHLKLPFIRKLEWHSPLVIQIK
jgi:hypothetical protein